MYIKWQKWQRSIYGKNGRGAFFNKSNVQKTNTNQNSTTRSDQDFSQKEKENSLDISPSMSSLRFTAFQGKPAEKKENRNEQ